MGFIIFISNKNNEFITISPNNKIKSIPSMTVGMIPKGTPIENQFLEEQEYGTNVNILYPNTWIDCVDSHGTGMPQWNSREETTGKVDKIILPRALNSYSFNKEKIVNMGGIINPNDILNDTQGINLDTGNTGKKIKDIYDNSFVNFKNLIPNKIIISDTFDTFNGEIEPSEFTTNTQLRQGASNLQYLTPDTWIYENEKGENGGAMYINKNIAVYASDPSTDGIVSSF
jgi:hypothetical protein